MPTIREIDSQLTESIQKLQAHLPVWEGMLANLKAKELPAEESMGNMDIQQQDLLHAHELAEAYQELLDNLTIDAVFISDPENVEDLKPLLDEAAERRKFIDNVESILLDINLRTLDLSALHLMESLKSALPIAQQLLSNLKEGSVNLHMTEQKMLEAQMDWLKAQTVVIKYQAVLRRLQAKQAFYRLHSSDNDNTELEDLAHYEQTIAVHVKACQSIGEILTGINVEIASYKLARLGVNESSGLLPPQASRTFTPSRSRQQGSEESIMEQVPINKPRKRGCCSCMRL